MISRRPLIPAALVAAAALAPAATAQTSPTLQFDRACYAEHQRMAFTGAGYTPGGEVDLVFARLGSVLGLFRTNADAAGALSGFVMAEEDQMLAEDEDRAQRFVSADDRTRIDQGAQPPESQFGTAAFTFTRWMGFSPGRYVPGRRASAVEVYGWAFAEGMPAYFLFRKGGRTVAAVKLGTIAGPCGDLKARPKVPRRLRAGAYKVWLSTDARRPSARSTWRTARVTRKASAAAARTAPMRRAG